MSDASVLPRDGHSPVLWRGLAGAGGALHLARAAARLAQPLLVVTRDAAAVARLEDELRFFVPAELPVLTFPDYETLPISCGSSQCSYASSCDETSDFQALYATVEQDSGIYVCQSSYAAEFDGDINLKYTERVEVLHATEDFTLVKKINGQTGYVSTRCVTSLEEFMKRF